MDVLDQMMAFEAGELDDDQVIELFQTLVNDGTVWSLQGHYGRYAQALIDNGLVSPVEVKS